MSTEHPDPARYWKHRRRLAYWAMALLTISLGLALAGTVRESMVPLVEGLCWIFGVIVLGYYGGNAVEAMAKKGR